MISALKKGKEFVRMKAYPSLLSLVVLLGHLVGTITVQAEEGEFVSRAQAVEENISDVPSKGALEQGGQTLGQTAPLNGDLAAGSTAESQSSRPESVKITRAIRQQIIEKKDLSTAAKNVKITTDDKGAVTLRGPVRTTNERQAIEQIARKNAHGAQVTNELVVKGEETSR
jgi:osmotically-inducible protein OsmY